MTVTRPYRSLSFIAALIFTLFDLGGYGVLVVRRGLPITMYRIAQALFQCAIIAGLWYWIDWRAAAAFVLVWWTGGCDVLYYPIGKILGVHNSDILGERGWHWLWWTPVGLIQFLPAWPRVGYARARADVSMTSVTVLWQAGAGLVMAVILEVV